jgi:beta-fructofuranosidase
MGFIHTTSEQDFVGEVSDPIPVSVDADGLLHAHPVRAEGKI